MINEYFNKESYITKQLELTLIPDCSSGGVMVKFLSIGRLESSSHNPQRSLKRPVIKGMASLSLFFTVVPWMLRYVLRLDTFIPKELLISTFDDANRSSSLRHEYQQTQTLPMT